MTIIIGHEKEVNADLMSSKPMYRKTAMNSATPTRIDTINQNVFFIFRISVTHEIVSGQCKKPAHFCREPLYALMYTVKLRARLQEADSEGYESLQFPFFGAQTASVTFYRRSDPAMSGHDAICAFPLRRTIRTRYKHGHRRTPCVEGVCMVYARVSYVKTRLKVEFPLSSSDAIYPTTTRSGYSVRIRFFAFSSSPN